MLQIILACSTAVCIIGIPKSLKRRLKNTQTVISLYSYVLGFDRNSQIFHIARAVRPRKSPLSGNISRCVLFRRNKWHETRALRPSLNCKPSALDVCCWYTIFSLIVPFHPLLSLNHGMGSIAPLSISGSSPPYRIPLSYISPPTPPAPPMPWGMSGLCSTMSSRPVLYFIPPLTLAWTFSYEDCQLYWLGFAVSLNTEYREQRKGENMAVRNNVRDK